MCGFMPCCYKWTTGCYDQLPEILADQHYETITSYLKPHSIKVDILKGSTSEKERQRIFKDLKEGKTQILVGTHAIIQGKC